MCLLITLLDWSDNLSSAHPYKEPSYGCTGWRISELRNCTILGLASEILSSKRLVIRPTSDLVKPTITFIIIMKFTTRHRSVSFSIQSLPLFQMS
jgi:hypothetical protein